MARMSSAAQLVFANQGCFLISCVLLEPNRFLGFLSNNPVRRFCKLGETCIKIIVLRRVFLVASIEWPQTIGFYFPYRMVGNL
jgi:hypothetical protein